MTLFQKTTGPVGRVLALAAFLLFLGGCATYGPGAGYPGTGYPGTGYPDQGRYPGQPYPDDRYGSQSLTATVDAVDPRSQRLLLVTQAAYGSTGSRVEVYYDRNTRLMYQGRAVAVEGLERGDVIRVQTAQSGGRLWARNIEVVHNVRDGAGGSQYGNELRGTVGYIDPRARTIELDSGGYAGSYGGNRTRLRYDERTLVEYQGRRYRPEDLDRGDLVRVQARQIGGNEWLAERILVERSVRTR